MNHGLLIDGKCFQVQEDGNDLPCIYEAIYLGRNHAWYSYKNIESGEQWKELGEKWYRTREDALRAYINMRMCWMYQMPFILTFMKMSREDVFRQVVRACAVLDKVLKPDDFGGYEEIGGR